MTIQASLADGTLLEFPDGTDERVIDSVVKRHVSGGESTLSDVVKSMAYAPAKAAVGLAGFAGDIRDLVGVGKEKISSYLPDWARNADKIASAVSPFANIPRLFPNSAPLRAAAEKVTGPWHDPQTRAGKVADTATQAAATFGRSLVTNARQALPVIGGITAGTEGAGALTGDNPIARLGGGLVGGGIPAIAQAMRGRPGVILKEGLGGKTPDEIAAAVAQQEAARAQGVPLLGTESFDTGHQLASAVLAHPSGNKILEEFLRKRPQQVEAAVQGNILGQTGPMGIPSANAARAQQAATDVIGKAEAGRTAAVSPFYNAASIESVPPQALRPVANELQNLMFQAPQNSAAERALGGWYKQLFPGEPAAVAPEVVSKARTGAAVTVNPNQDDIITAIRKLGGITPKDESIGSLAQHMVFPPDPRFGPVWRQSEYRGATGTKAGHSPDRMAELLYEKGYLESRDDLGGMMSKIEDSAMGSATHHSMFYEPPSSDPLVNTLERLTKQLEVKNLPKMGGPKAQAPEAALPETNVGRLNEIYKNLGIERDIPSIGATAEQKMASYPAGQIQDVLGNVLKGQNENLRKGQALYADITAKRIEPLRAGPVGLVAGKRGMEPGEASPVPRIVSAIADQNTRPENIRTLYGELNTIDKQAFPGIVQTYIESRLNASLEKIRSGPNPTAGAKFAQAIAGSPQEHANFNEMMRGVAQAHGADADAVVSGANNLLRTLELTGRTPGMGSQTASRGEVTKELGKSLLSETLSMISLTPTKPLARRIHDRILRGRYDEMAQALVAPNSVQLLAKMAKLQPDSVTAQYYAAMVLGLDKAIAGDQ